jgi:hypothetical protein
MSTPSKLQKVQKPALFTKYITSAQVAFKLSIKRFISSFLERSIT